MSVKKAYQCSGCDGIHDYESEAEACCQPDVATVYICPTCRSTHDDHGGAVDCCEFDTLVDDEDEDLTVDCPTCLRIYQSSDIGFHAVQIAGHCQACNPLFTLEQQFQIEDAASESDVDAFGCLTGDSKSLLRGEPDLS